MHVEVVLQASLAPSLSKATPLNPQQDYLAPLIRYESKRD